MIFLWGQWTSWQVMVRCTVFILTMSQKKLAVQYTIGLTPLTNCRCLACVTLSWIRYSTKLAGTKDMAKITQMATTASTEVVSLREWINKQYLHTQTFYILNWDWFASKTTVWNSVSITLTLWPPTAVPWSGLVDDWWLWCHTHLNWHQEAGWLEGWRYSPRSWRPP